MIWDGKRPCDFQLWDGFRRSKDVVHWFDSFALGRGGMFWTTVIFVLCTCTLVVRTLEDPKPPMVLRELQARCSFDVAVAGICLNHVIDVNRGSVSKLKTFANFKLWTLWTNLWFCGHWVSRLGGGSRGAEEAEDAIGQALPSSTSLLPAEVSGASSSQADQPEITVPTLVPGMVAATPNSLDGTQKELGPKSGRSPEALDWHSCDSSDSMEAAHLQRVQTSQNSTPSDDLVDSRSPQHKGIRMSLPLLAACHFAGFWHDFTSGCACKFGVWHFSCSFCLVWFLPLPFRGV